MAHTSIGQRVLTLALLGLISGACDKNNEAVPRLSNQGESCRATSDCAGSLICVSQTCSASDVPIDPTSQRCELVQCINPVDCCVPNAMVTATQCETWLVSCQADAGLTSSGDCILHQTYCCDPTASATKYACNNGQCQRQCATDTDCTSSTLSHCSPAHTCVQCLDYSNCPTGDMCVDNACVATCTSRAQCPAFQDCQGSHCVKVGCANDRECIVALTDVTAYCDSTHTCNLKCTNDVECLNRTITNVGNIYSYQVCASGNCQNAGCASDDECKALLTTQIQSLKNNGYAQATASCVVQ
jgi:hypothetical protein